MSFFDKMVKHLDLDDFDKRDKVAFVSLACVTVVIIVLWVMQLNRNIVNPLYGGLDPNQLKQETLNTQSSATVAETNLKNQDTDKDGLSDWDELNVYKTSPYLADSDSDGINDYDEVKKGTDPNCPSGQDCSGVTQSADTSFNNSNLSELLDQPISSTVTPAVTSTTTPQTNSGTELTTQEKEAFTKLIGSNKDPKILRDFLLANGADKTYIDSISDQDLKKVIEEFLK